MPATVLQIRKTLFYFIICCILAVMFLPAFASSTPSPSAGHSIIADYDIFFEDTPSATIAQIAAPKFSPIFTPASTTDIPPTVKRVWLRITIPALRLAELRKEGLFAFMKFGGRIQRPATIFYEQANAPGTWKSFTVTRCNAQLPPPPAGGAAQYYVQIEGKPSFWFTPEVTLEKEAFPIFADQIARWVLLGLILGIAGLNVCLAIFTRAESCFWLSIYSLLATGYYATSMAPSPTVGLEFSTAWTILLPGLALLILPHIGRNLFFETTCPKQVDTQLWAISVLGVLVAIIPLIPGLGGTIYYLPLWPILALVGAVSGSLAVIHKIPGGKRFTGGCIITGLGGAIALLPASTADAAGILQLMPLAGVAAGLLIFTPVALTDSKLLVAPSKDDTDAPEPEEKITLTPDELIKRISHDLQSPLVTIASVSDQLSNSAIPEEDQRALQTLQSATHVLQLQLQDLLDLNRADNNRLTLHHQTFDLQSLLKDTYHIMIPHAEEKGLSLSWQMAPNLPIRYNGDSRRLIQILLNLVGNAIRFSDSGEVSISVSELDHDDNSVYLLFKVKDQGRGIPLRNKYDVLDRFCQDPEERSGKYCGAGLGLSVTAELVQLMEGFMCIESETNVGTAVLFSAKIHLHGAKSQTELPTSYIPSGEKLEVEETADPAQLLIIDTRKGIEENISELVADESITVHEVAALDKARITYKALTVDAIVIASDSLEETERIFEELSNIDIEMGCFSAPAIAITADADHIPQLMTSGFFEVMEHPVSSDEFMTVLAKLGVHESSINLTQDMVGNVAKDLPEVSVNITSRELSHLTEPLSVDEEDIERSDEFEFSEPQDAPEKSEVDENKVNELPMEEILMNTLEAAVEDLIETEEPAPQVPMKGISSSEEAESIFERIAQERRLEQAVEQVSNENEAALTCYDEPEEQAKTDWNDTPLTEAVSHLRLDSAEATHPAEVLDIMLLPKIPKIISQLQETYEEICLQAEQKSTSGVLASSEKLQEQAQKYALREVQRMASCVERAARAQDNTAIQDLMTELEAVVVQTGKALRDVYRLRTSIPDATQEDL